MGNVISVLHYSSRSDSAEAPRCDDRESDAGAQHESENRTVDMVNEDEQTPKCEAEGEPNDDAANETSREEEMEQFRQELAAKRETRRKILADRTNEMKSLQKQLAAERRIRENVVTENSTLRSLLAENNIGVTEVNDQNTTVVGDLQAGMAEMEEANSLLRQQNVCLRSELSESHGALQSANSDNTLLNKEIFESRRQISALKDVVEVSKKMLAIRENQLMQLKEKLLEIEKSIADRETVILSDHLRAEYEKQLLNIRNLRILYEERARVAEVTRRNLTRQLDDQKLLTTVEIDKNQNLSKQIEELQKDVQEKEDVIRTKDDELETCLTETKGLQLEMAGINKLFTQMLLGFNKNQNLDKLVNRLEEHHDLLRDMAVKEHCSDAASALPKLLMDLVSQVENEEKDSEDEDKSESIKSSTSSRGLSSSQEIIGNLPKVWRVLMELLSHQNSSTDSMNAEDGEKPNSCYKSVQTPSGPCLVPSVSRTYIRLKDLILEKKSLQKDMTKMKQLNSHLDSRLQDQERRLCLVTSELTKTWHVVGRLRRHHQQLHTHEKILRYELQHKRKLLTEIKEELEYCREKWDMARQKNVESEAEWQKLRQEFADRKKRPRSDSVNTSAESGFSDERQSDDDDSHSSNNYDREEKLRSLQKTLPRVENLPESTTDHNPMAEGEDPISDMVDVTDLPLDEQGNESEDNSNAILSESEDPVESEDISVADTGPKMKTKVKHKLHNKTTNIKNDVPTASKICSNVETGIAGTIGEQSNTNHSTGLQINRASAENINENIPLEVLQSIVLSEDTHLSAATSHNFSSPQQIMENLKLQNERLKLKEERMQRLESGCNNLTRQVTQANDRGNLLTRRVDILSIKSKTPLTASAQNDNDESNSGGHETMAEQAETCLAIPKDTEYVIQNIEGLTDDLNTKPASNENQISKEEDVSGSENIELENQDEECDIPSTSQENNLISPTQILENNRTQDEDLASRDIMLKNIENECEHIVNENAEDIKPLSKEECSELKEQPDSSIEQPVSTSIKSVDGDDRIAVQGLTIMNLENECVPKETIVKNDTSETLNLKHNEINTDLVEKGSHLTLKEEPEIVKNLATNKETSTKSTYSDYEERLIAKEERMKRLEDQAKSLVTKVNDTETKRVKINYKLEELHNIYGVSDDQSSSNESSATSNSSSHQEPSEKKDKKNSTDKEDTA